MCIPRINTLVVPINLHDIVILGGSDVGKFGCHSGFKVFYLRAEKCSYLAGSFCRLESSSNQAIRVSRDTVVALVTDADRGDHLISYTRGEGRVKIIEDL